jgi:hypothetical protein
VIGSTEAYCAIRCHCVVSIVGPCPDQYAGRMIPFCSLSDAFALDGKL